MPAGETPRPTPPSPPYEPPALEAFGEPPGPAPATYPWPSALIEPLALTTIDAALMLTPVPCHVLFTRAELLIDCATTIPLTVKEFATVTVEPPPIVRTAPGCTVIEL